MAGSVLMEKHFNNSINDEVLLATSESGYSNAYLGMEWLKHFNGQTASQQKGKYQMLVFDIYRSHLTDEFTYYC
jgi:hypothetical protein